MAPEVVAGVAGITLAVAGQLTGGYDVFIADAVISGMTGIFGAFAFSNSVGLHRDLHKIISILVGAGFASIFGPLFAAYAEFQLPWLLPFGYLNDAAAGVVIGLTTSPIIGTIRNPAPVVVFLAGLVPFLGGKKKDS